MANPPKFPQIATALLVLGALLIKFLFPLTAHADTIVQLFVYAVAFGAILVGGFLAMRHYWTYDKPMFKRKVVLLAFGIVLGIGGYVFIIHPESIHIPTAHR